jgi:hypothetical protein
MRYGSETSAAEMQNRRGEGGAGKERILWFFSKWTVDEGSVRKGYRDETPGQGHVQEEPLSALSLPTDIKIDGVWCGGM